jgi:hypothetical protein
VTERDTGVDLYWLPLGAGGHSVRLNGRIFEAATALLKGANAATFITPRCRCTCPKDDS